GIYQLIRSWRARRVVHDDAADKQVLIDCEHQIKRPIGIRRDFGSNRAKPSGREKLLNRRLNDGSIEFCARLERKQFEQVVLIGAMRICEADAAHSVSRILVECTRGLISARLIESTLRNRKSRCVRSLRREENAQQLSSGRLGIAGQRNRKSETDCQDRAPTPAIEQNANQRLPPKNA